MAHNNAPGNKRRSDQKGGARKAHNNKIYANPLPLEFSQPASKGFSAHVVGIFGLSATRLENPHCEGVLDRATRSIWVSNARDSLILWRRGFFGKGDLSRSEPSWHARELNARRLAGKSMTSEEMRERRRAERKQFKQDRAAAIAQAAAEAEVAFAEGRAAAPTVIPSGTTWKATPTAPGDNSSSTPDLPEEIAEEDVNPVEPFEDLEHLQLTFQEAWFLVWTLDCLTILDPCTSQPMTLKQIWDAFHDAHCLPGVPPELSSPYANRADNPFLVHYAAYHYYRALGWVVKGGIKFCVDYLLYKRGPVFNHAEFAVVVIPVYEDPADQESSPFVLANATPFSWSWLSTINRVNSQVQKTLILTYVTIPTQARVEGLSTSPACLAHYSVREVVLRRFIPARMRD